ncbi:Protein of unknown function, partial [Gryllus bimaculatus]
MIPGGVRLKSRLQLDLTFIRIQRV